MSLSERRAQSSDATDKTIKKIKLSVSRLNNDDTSALGDAIVASMTNNPNFQSPDPGLNTLTQGSQLIRNKQTAITQAEADLTVLRSELAQAVLDQKMNIRLMANYVQDESDGNPDKIHSAGFQVVGDPEPRGPLAQVSNLTVQVSDNEGQLILRWTAVPGRLCYVIDMATDPSGPWQNAAGTSATPEYTFTSLTPGSKYWFRVRAFGSQGFGPFSDPACRIAA